MAYGFQVLNQDGVLVANDTDFNYGLLTSGVRNIGRFGSTAYSSNTIRFDSEVSTTDAKPLVFVRLTDPNYYISILNFTNTQATFIISNSAGGNVFDPPADTLLTLHFKVFVPFNKLPAYSGSDNYGLQVYSSSSAVTFDSRYEIPLIIASGTCAANTVSPLNETTFALPTGYTINNTWICLNSIAEGRIGNKAFNGTLHSVYQAIKISGNYVYMTHIYKPEDSAYSGSDYFGNISRTFLLADQPNVVYPLKLQLYNNPYWTLSSCQINYALQGYSIHQSNIGTCSTYFRYEADVSGGNGNPISYSWSLSNNSAGYYISGTTNSSYVTVTLIKVQGSYSCTLTCTVSQAGGESKTQSIVLSSTHTQNLLATATLSIDGKAPPYTITEGETVTFRANTTGKSDGSLVLFGLHGYGSNPTSTSDFEPATTDIASQVSNNTSTVIKYITIGAVESTETFYLKVFGGNYGSDSLMAIVPVSIANSTVSTNYSVTANPTSIDETSTQVVNFTISSTGLQALTQVWWRIEGISGTINSSDFVDTAGMSGSVYVGPQWNSETYTYDDITASVPKTARADATTENSESFTLKLYSESSFTTLLANGPTVTIGDTSTTPPPPAPVASFTKSAATGAYPLTVNFQDTSTNNPTSWSWNFGNGDPLNTQQSPQGIVYSTAGTFTVSLTAGNNGGSSSTSQQIVVTAPIAAPVASFTKSVSSGTAPLYVEFFDSSTNNPTSWSWNFGDGSPVSTTQNTTKTYLNVATTTNYTVTLTVENQGGSSSSSQTVTVSPATVTIYTEGDTGGTVGQAFTKDFYLRLNGTNQASKFSFGGSLISGTSFTSQQLLYSTFFDDYYLFCRISGTPTTAGTYNFTISATSSGGYYASQAYTITISAPAAPLPTADFTASPTNVGLDQVVSFDGTGSTNAVTWQWDFNNSGTYTATSSTASTAYVNTGIYDVKLRVTNSDGVENILTRYGYITVEATNYNEVITMDSYLTYTQRTSDTTPNIYTVYTNQVFNMYIVGGRPYQPFSWTGPTSGTGTLNASGNYTWTNNQLAAQEYNWTITLVVEGTIATPIVTHTRTIRITGVTPPAATVPNPLPFNGVLYTDLGEVDGSAQAELTLLRNGTWSVDGFSGNLDFGNWVTPATTTVGDSFWCKFTRGTTSSASTTSSTSTTYSNTTGWLQLNTAQSAYIQISTAASSLRSSQAIFTVQIATDAAGTNIVSTSTITLRVTARIQ